MATLLLKRSGRLGKPFARAIGNLVLVCTFTTIFSVKFQRPYQSQGLDPDVLDSEVLADLDECALKSHDCSPMASCISDHDAGGYRCECNIGWTGDGRKCVNENECRIPQVCGANAVCTDTLGSYTCACASGYQMEEETCVDVNECDTGLHACLPEADCKNTGGSFTCACPLGFNGDGSTMCADMCGPAAPAQRIDCFQDGNATEGLCEARGCCWDGSKASANSPVPACYYPLPANSYALHGAQSSRGAEGVLECSGQMRYGDGRGGGGKRPFHIGPFGSEICPLHLSVTYETPNRLRIRIFDPSAERWEVPHSLFPDPVPEPQTDERQYSVSYTKAPFGFAITRVATSEVLFNSTPVPARSNGLTFEQQFLSITGQVESDPILYGLGEHVAPFRQIGRAHV